MSYLERLLQREIDKGRASGAVAQSLRSQIANQASGQSAQDMYVAGMIKKQK
jgi:hypothetical protein